VVRRAQYVKKHLKTLLRVKMYDARHGTHFYEALQRKQADERDFAFATSIGLYIEPECAKHRKSLDDVRGLAGAH
jgi:hypothetical protein